MALTLRVPNVSAFLLKFSPSPAYPYHKRAKMSQNVRFNASLSASAGSTNRRLPILLFDIMDTLVRDPFYHDVPAFFGMSLKELIECKHPTAWMEFEKGLIDEMELSRIFFKDGRTFNLEGLKNCMRRGYSYIEGVEELLHALKKNGYEIHAFTNYPIWYKMIEDKLKVSRYLSWTFCSCINGFLLSCEAELVKSNPPKQKIFSLFRCSCMKRQDTYYMDIAITCENDLVLPYVSGKRKPDSDFYLDVLSQLKVNPENCIFIDDRLKNVEAAAEVGIVSLHFKNTNLLLQDLSSMGIDILVEENHCQD